ncbi:MAG TPA: DUF192 domain-containing protein [Candidatus Aquilonibacter sp.]|nr:DUF192 domain-containing protein [Candidatus Aquilonibacter sp.]
MNYSKLLIPSAAIIFLLVAGILLLSKTSSAQYSQFSVDGKSFPITYLALNQAQWEKGLMNATVTNTTTMLFVFTNPGIYPFWMFDTDYNLDMIWVNGTATSGKIVYVIENATSCFDASNCTIYTPNKTSNYVIEAKAGFVKRNGISTGDSVNFS